ncbi:glycosyltransferase family 4 protein [Marinifilum fragile]|uniref:glycosyltransferase family 4 protein n=1 Tax=Marinifilum fragile TaxID=570161 RepID=UPI002AAB2C3E|nr:glycosyltransferase family 4 protein [Marinifilum fragile]
MNILIVSQYFYPEEFKVNDIAFEMQKRGHAVTVLTGKPNYPKGKFFNGYSFLGKKQEQIKGVRVIRTPLIPRSKGGGIMLFLNYLSFVLFGCLTALFRIRGKFDVIFVHEVSPITVALPAILLKKKLKCPMYLWVLDLWPESVTAAGGVTNKIVLNILKSLVRFIYRHSNKILISSEGFRKSVESLIEGEKPIIYFPNWAEEVFTNKSQSVLELLDFPEGFNVLFAGNIGESQNIETIIEAAKLTVGEVNWLFVGDGRKRMMLEETKEKQNITNIYIFGRYPLQTMPFFFKKADVMLITLKNEYIFNLIVPAKMQAYLASGKAILGAIGYEAADMIKEAKVGYACSPDDFMKLAENAKKLSCNREVIKEFEDNAKLFYQANFERGMLMNKIEEILTNSKNEIKL